MRASDRRGHHAARKPSHLRVPRVPLEGPACIRGMESVSHRVAPIVGVFAAGVLAPGSWEEPNSPARPQISTCRGLSGSHAPGFRVTWHSDCKQGQGQAACAGDMFVTSTKLGSPHPRSPAPGAGGKIGGTHHWLAYRGGGTAAALKGGQGGGGGACQATGGLRGEASRSRRIPMPGVRTTRPGKARGLLITVNVCDMVRQST